MPNQNPSPEKTAAERMEEAIKGVDFTAVNFSMDTLYDARFPSEVTRHEFRQFCQRKMKEAAKAPPVAVTDFKLNDIPTLVNGADPEAGAKAPKE
jgi:hypothetical protein